MYPQHLPKAASVVRGERLHGDEVEEVVEDEVQGLGQFVPNDGEARVEQAFAEHAPDLRLVPIFV